MLSKQREGRIRILESIPKTIEDAKFYAFALVLDLILNCGSVPIKTKTMLSITNCYQCHFILQNILQNELLHTLDADRSVVYC